MDENEAVVVAEEVVKEAVAEERNFEVEAREIGWVPEEEFKGDKDRWKPAQKFVEDGEKILPILKANERKLREELKTERASFAQRVERLEKVTKAAHERDLASYKAEITQLKAQQRQAVEVGDVDAFERIDKQLDKMAPPEAPEEPEGRAVETEEYIAKLDEDYASKSDWYRKDPDLTAYAIGVSRKLANDSPGLPMATNIKMTEAKVKAMFPDKFKKPAANGHAAVDGGGAFTGSAPSRKGFDSLPAEAKSAYERFDTKIKAVMTKAQYAEEYLNG